MARPEPTVISMELTAGEEAVRLRWDPTDTEDEGGAAAESPWELQSEPDWGRLDGIRLISAHFDDGGLLAVAALRPRAARGHGEDVVIARFIDAEGEETTTSDAFLSVEYDAAGTPRRLGLEVWPEPDAAPLRVAADRDVKAASPRADGREAVAMSFRLQGTPGTGLYEVLRSG
jgi:hypothetical protein